MIPEPFAVLALLGVYGALSFGAIVAVILAPIGAAILSKGPSL